MHRAAMRRPASMLFHWACADGTCPSTALALRYGLWSRWSTSEATRIMLMETILATHSTQKAACRQADNGPSCWKVGFKVIGKVALANFNAILRSSLSTWLHAVIRREDVFLKYFYSFLGVATWPQRSSTKTFGRSFDHISKPTWAAFPVPPSAHNPPCRILSGTT